MTKHDNYNNPCVIKITKLHQKQYDYDYYVLSYEDEDWELTATEEELFEELAEHLELMKAKERR